MRPGFPERGSFGDLFAEIERRLQALESANRLTSASIGSGGLTVKNGGDITVDGGQFLIKTAGGDFALEPLDVELLSDLTASGTSSVSINPGDTLILSGTYTVPSWVTRVVVFAITEGVFTNVSSNFVTVRYDADGDLSPNRDFGGGGSTPVNFVRSWATDKAPSGGTFDVEFHITADSNNTGTANVTVTVFNAIVLAL